MGENVNPARTIYKILSTLISSSCISRYSNFLLLSETESSEGKAVIPTVSTTSSGREDSVAWTASSGRTFPDTVKALQVIKDQDKSAVFHIFHIYIQKNEAVRNKFSNKKEKHTKTWWSSILPGKDQKRWGDRMIQRQIQPITELQREDKTSIY